MGERRLHIGALKPTPGWETLNAQPLEGIDHVCDARVLSQFPDNTFSALYASHILEHFDYKNEVPAVLAEWFRVLAPEGQLFVSVPDLETICRLYCDRDRFDSSERFWFMRILMGGHNDRYDFHQTAFSEESLVNFLTEAGFEDIRRPAEFSLFDDCSSICYRGELISLNLVAMKPKADKERQVSFSVTRAGRTYPFEYLFDTAQITQRTLAQHIQAGVLYEPEISLVLMQVLQDGDSFVDVGANVGFFTVMGARLVGDRGRVYAFEPEHSNFRRLQQNCELNGLTNVELFLTAVGDKDTPIDLYINSDNDGGHALWDPSAHSFNELSRKTTVLQKTTLMKLDTVFSTIPGSASRIKIIKIDTEGYEHHVLMGAVETIRQHRIPFVLAEINRFALHQAGSSERTFRLFMHHLGYSAYIADFSDGGALPRFMEIPYQFFPSPENPELLYNILFCLSGQLEEQGFEIVSSLQESRPHE